MPRRRGVTAAVLVAGALVAADTPVFLRPVNRSVTPPGRLSIVAKGAGELRLDGKPLAAERPAPGVVRATADVQPGRHVLSLGEVRIEFAVGEAPAGWKQFRPHPPAAECAACHAAQTWEPLGADACLTCHARETFAKAHTHNAEVLAECEMCHLPHGSGEAFHLKLAKDKACKQCHG